jgi:hypothetical protein
MDISSYRLTAVCSEKDNGTPAAIVAAIQEKKDFQYYSVIVYREDKDSIHYDWYLIPSDHPALNPASYTWKPKMGKRGKKKDVVVGWETDAVDGSDMDITFSMSSQLWMHICITDELRTHIVASCTASNKPKYSYIQLYEKEVA